MMGLFEWLVVGGILLGVGSVVLFSLWRFEKRRADALADRLSQLEETHATVEEEMTRWRTQSQQEALQRVRAETDNARLRAQVETAEQRLEQLQTVMQERARLSGELDRLLQAQDEWYAQRERQAEQLTQLQGQLAEAREENERLKTRLEAQQRQHQAEVALLKEARERLSEAFENLSNRIFEQKQQQFSLQSRQQLEQLLQPWQQQLAQFRQRVDELHSQQTRQIGVLQGELKQLRQLNETLSQEAEALARALRQDSKVQGNWGEQILTRLLEAAGLRQGHEFEREVALEGGRQRLDVLVRLPEGHTLIIDSKVSLKAYVTAMNAEEDTVRRQAARAHLDSVKAHIDTLGQKAYHLNDQLLTPEFTLMFIPIEGAYLLALEQDPELHEYAYRQGVALVTPPTLLTTLKTVAHLWRLARQDQDMIELMRLAGSLHDKFVGFTEAFDDVARHLAQADRAWHTARNRLLEGRGNVVSTLHRIGALSGRIRKKLPEDWENRALGEAQLAEAHDSSSARNLSDSQGEKT